MQPSRLFAAALLVLSAGGTASLAQSVLQVGFNSGGLDRINPAGTAVVGGNAKVTLSPFALTNFAYPTVSGINGVANNGTILCGDVQNTGVGNTFPLDATIGARFNGSVWALIPPLPTNTNGFGTISTGLGISGDGRFIAGYGWEGNQVMAYLFDNNDPGSSIRLGSASTGFFVGSKASGVNGDGSVVIGNDFNPDLEGSNTRMSAVWRRDAVTGQYVETVLDVAVNGRQGELYDVNEAGTVLVGTSTDNPTGGSRWSWNGTSYTRFDLPVPTRPDDVSPDAELWDMTPYGVSEDGNTIVGTVVWAAGFFDRSSHAFIWDSVNGSRVLRDVVGQLNPTAPGLSEYPKFAQATGISGDGTKIIGHGGQVGDFGFGGPVWLLDLNNSTPTPPTLTITPQNQLISQCGLFGMDVGVAGTGPFTYQWTRDGVVVTDGETPWGTSFFGATTDSLRIFSALHREDVGTYTCTITGYGGAQLVVSATASLDAAYPPPSNDTCAGATNVGEGLFQQSMCGAWVDQFRPACAPANAAVDLFFRYTPSFTGFARIDACGSEFDTNLSVTAACGGALLACNDNLDSGPDCGSNTAARIGRLPVTAGVPVIIRVGAGEYPLNGTNGQINLNIGQAPALPSNDSCSTPQDIGDGLSEFNNTEATTDGTAECNPDSARDIWFRYVPTQTGQIYVSTCGTNFNTVLSVQDSCGPNAVSLGCNDNAFDFANNCAYASTIQSVLVTANTPVLIRVASSDSSFGGGGVLTVAFSIPPCLADIAGGPSGGADGIVDGNDFVAFINAFSADDLLADVAGGDPTGGDGIVDGSDFIAFINAFGAGC
jgi:hypothetical protein